MTTGLFIRAALDAVIWGVLVGKAISIWLGYAEGNAFLYLAAAVAFQRLCRLEDRDPR